MSLDHDDLDRYVRLFDWKRDEELLQREWEEEERRDKMLRGEPFFNTADPDLYRDMRRGK